MFFDKWIVRCLHASATPRMTLEASNPVVPWVLFSSRWGSGMLCRVCTIGTADTSLGIGSWQASMVFCGRRSKVGSWSM